MQHLKKPPIGRVIFHDNLLPKEKLFCNIYNSKIRHVLLKYYPKYLHKLKCNFSDGYLSTRLKRIKFIKNLSCFTLNRNFWRLLTANKRKSVTKFDYSPCGYTEDTWIIEKLRAFQGLKKIELSIFQEDEEDWGSQVQRERERKSHWMRRVCYYLNRAYGLRCLRVETDDNRFLKILSKLSSSERMLSRLEAFEMELSWYSSDDQTVILEFSQYKTAIKYLTYLNLDIFAHPESFQVLQLLPNYCPQLTCLSFSTSARKFFKDDGTNLFFFDYIVCENSDFLGCLKNFRCLQQLEITSYCGLKFLRKCQFPASLLHLSLKFYNFWCKEQDFSLQVGMERLEKLETLNIEFLIRWNRNLEYNNEEFVPEDETQEMLQEDDHLKRHFLQGLLSKVVSPLKKLSLTLSRSRFAEKSHRRIKRYQGDFNLSDFLRPIGHLRKSLTTLHIKDRFLEYRLQLNDDDQPLLFPRLSELFLETDISPLTDFEKLFKLMQVKNGHPKRCVALHGIRINSCEGLLNFFLRLRGVKGITGLCLKLHLYVQNLDNDVEYFERNSGYVMKQVGELKNILLWITTPKSGFLEKKETEALLSLFGRVDFVKIHPDWFDKMCAFLKKEL